MPQLDRKEALERLRRAKGAHIKWRAYAQALVSGVKVDADKIPVEHTDCAFGLWYHGEGRRQLGHLSAYESIDTPHEMLHAIYKRIFEVLQSEQETGTLRKVFTSRVSRERQRLETARQYMTELVGVSETLLKALEILEQEIRELPEQ